MASHFMRPAQIGLVLIMVASNAMAQEASFAGIGFPPDDGGGGASSSAWGVSGDGGVITGQGFGSSSGAGAIRWENGQMEVLDGFSHIGFGISADGLVIVGYGNQGNGDEAYRWEDGVTIGLGDLPGGDFESYAWDVSGDGLVVVGESESASGDRPFRWEDSVMVELPAVPGGGSGSAWGVSDDGRIIVGISGGIAVRWVEGVLEELPRPPESSVYQARDVSSDGSVVVGQFSPISPGSQQAFIWREGEGTVEIPHPTDPDALIQAHAVSGDGRVVSGATLSGPFIWTEETGTWLLKDLLEDVYGLDLTGWGLSAVWYNGVNYDGTVIVGEGVNPDGDFEGWRAELPPWPVTNAPEAPETTQIEVSVYPNPVRDRATVRVMLPAAVHARIDVLDVLGRVVAVLHDGTLAAGAHSFSLSTERLPAGVYVVRADFGKTGVVSRVVTVLR